MIVWSWSDYEEILHVQEQRSLSEMVGAGAAAVLCWSDFEETAHFQGQRRSPSKMVGGVKSCLFIYFLNVFILIGD